MSSFIQEPSLNNERIFRNLLQNLLRVVPLSNASNLYKILQTELQGYIIYQKTFSCLNNFFSEILRIRKTRVHQQIRDFFRRISGVYSIMISARAFQMNLILKPKQLFEQIEIFGQPQTTSQNFNFYEFPNLVEICLRLPEVVKAASLKFLC